MQCPVCLEQLTFEPSPTDARALGPAGLGRCACPVAAPVALGIVFLSGTGAGKWLEASRAVAEGRVGAALSILTGVSARAVEQLASDHALSMQDFFDAVPPGPLSHFFDCMRYRPATTTFRASMPFLNALAANGGPYLDVAGAVGFGGATIAALAPGAHVTLVDMSPLLCLCARLFTLPANSSVVCLNLDSGWPFPADTFGGVLCSDALQYFSHKEMLCRRIGRSLVPAGLAAFPHVHNIRRARDIGEFGLGHALTPDDYHATVGPGRLMAFDELDLAAAWRRGATPRPRSATELADVTNLHYALGKSRPPTLSWDACRGWETVELCLNPAFQVRDRLPDGTLQVERRRLPEKLLVEFSELSEAFPAQAQIDPRPLEGSRAGDHDLVRRGWAVPLPPRAMAPTERVVLRRGAS